MFQFGIIRRSFILISILPLGMAQAEDPSKGKVRASESDSQSEVKISAEHREFFEKRIRPVLVEHCYECHSVDSKKLRGELLLDSRWGWQQGGESGPVIVPNRPDESTLTGALRYEDFEMPPKGKLPVAVLADFYKWIEMGAPDPRAKRSRDAKQEDQFDLDERKKWWSLQPVREIPVPNVQNKVWPASDHDYFILAKLEAKGWGPSKPASKNSWLRRVTYDLTGLPPTPQELADFLADRDDAARVKVVDRLLGSKHFGEQWARHWMDLVRYAETKAFEADYPMANAYQYRDYLIRAFNDDVPYNQFVREAIAGDLLEPRLNQKTGINESVMGPGYLYLTDGQHGPPDVHLDEARIFDDMIDVLGKAFLSQTIACARCHDHKFDAITTQDYYSLYGVIASSRIDYADINPPKLQQKLRRQLIDEKASVRTALGELLLGDMRELRSDLLAAVEGKAESEQQKRWQAALKSNKNEIIKTLGALLGTNDTKVWNQFRDQKTASISTIGGLTRDDFGDWIASSGPSFGGAPRPAGDFITHGNGDEVVASFVGGRPAAGHLASRFAGSIKSPRFVIEGDSVSVRVKGKNVRVSLYVRHYELVGRGPTTGGTTKVINSDDWQTVRFGTKLWVGEPAYIEIQQNGGEMKFDWSTGSHVDGAYAVLDSATNNRPLPPLPPVNQAWGIVGKSPSSHLDHVVTQIKSAVAAWKDGSLNIAQSDLLQGLHEAGAFEFNINRSKKLSSSVQSLRKVQSEVPTPTYVRTLSDGPGADEPVYIRGSHKNLSVEPNPRHFMHSIQATPFQGRGSGRLHWANSLASESNPLTARVMVNRIWHHLYGRGIVYSVDDFGHMGDQPSHPELLDFLTAQFMKNGWSMKSLIREIVLSSSYGMSSRPSDDSLASDPNNILLQHMPVRRLQAEAIRDTLLAVSGEIDLNLFGPSMKGDGGNRRTIYIQLRRRYMPDFLMTFDFPNSTEPFGRRNITAGPTQSLALMNGHLAWNAADKWAHRMLKLNDHPFTERINVMHQQAFARGASDREVEWARGFLQDLGTDEDNVRHRHWKEICHTMLNRKELIYVY